MRPPPPIMPRAVTVPDSTVVCEAIPVYGGGIGGAPRAVGYAHRPGPGYKPPGTLPAYLDPRREEELQEPFDLSVLQRDDTTHEWTTLIIDGRAYPSATPRQE